MLKFRFKKIEKSKAYLSPTEVDMAHFFNTDDFGIRSTLPDRKPFLGSSLCERVKEAYI